jgi:hypothetical protein
MASSAAVVNRAIKAQARPFLADEGFDDFTQRKAWRRHDGVVDVVNFQAVGSSSAYGVGCTPHSFSVYLGLLYPGWWQADERSETARPDYWDCTFAYVLPTSVAQDDAFHPYGSDCGGARPDTWAVRDDASDADAMVADAVTSLRTTGMPWLDEARDPELMYRLYLQGPPRVPTGEAGLIGTFGLPGSPDWIRVVRLMAAILGRDVDTDIESTR